MIQKSCRGYAASIWFDFFAKIPFISAGSIHFPATNTQDDIFGFDLAKYTFTEQCEEIAGLHLEDGTKKIFLNMNSKNGSPELVSLLQ